MTTSTETTAEPLTDSDVIGQLARISADSPLGQLRAQRPDIIRYAQSSYLSLIEPADLGGLSRHERELTGLRVATLTGTSALASWHRERLRQLGASDDTIAAIEGFPESTALSTRERALLAHIQRVALAPAKSTPEDLESLAAVGLSARDIVTFSQLITFLSFQARTLIGLRLLGEAL
jgi:CMD domain protein